MATEEAANGSQPRNGEAKSPLPEENSDGPTLRTLKIDAVNFVSAFGRDVDFAGQEWLAYLDLETGGIDWLRSDDEDASCEEEKENNKDLRKMFAANPDRHWELPGLSHAECHELIQQYDDLTRTFSSEDAEESQVEYEGSIGKYRHAAGVDTNRDFDDYRATQLKQRAEELLREKRIKPIWT